MGNTNFFDEILELDLPETEPKIILTDRAHHINVLSKILIDHNPIQGIPLAAFDFTEEVFINRKARVNELALTLEFYDSIQQSLNILLAIPWFRKLLKVIIQSSFTAKFVGSNRSVMSTWDNIKDYLLTYFEYIIQSALLESIPSTTKELGVTDLTDIDNFIKTYGEQIKNTDSTIVNCLVTTLKTIFNHELLRKELLPLLFSAPIYLDVFFRVQTNTINDELDYFKDIGIFADTDINTDAMNFSRFQDIAEQLITAYYVNPNDQVEFTTQPGAICTTAAKTSTKFGRHCSRHFNADDDSTYLVTLEVISEEFPEYADSIEIVLDDKDNILSVKVALKLIADQQFMGTVKRIRSEIIFTQMVDLCNDFTVEA